LRDGSRRTAEELLKGKKRCRKRNVFVNGTRLNLCLSYDVKGELLYLIGTLEPHYLKAFYRKRTIELVFQALKNRGFYLEQSSLKSLKKYRKLLLWFV
jgi:hypothetical protein